MPQFLIRNDTHRVFINHYDEEPLQDPNDAECAALRAFYATPAGRDEDGKEMELSGEEIPGIDGDPVSFPV